MQTGRNKDNEIRMLYRQMSEKCEEYIILKKLPEGRTRAAEVKVEILGLYAEIAKLCGKAPELTPDSFL